MKFTFLKYMDYGRKLEKGGEDKIWNSHWKKGGNN